MKCTREWRSMANDFVWQRQLFVHLPLFSFHSFLVFLVFLAMVSQKDGRSPTCAVIYLLFRSKQIQINFMWINRKLFVLCLSVIAHCASERRRKKNELFEVKRTARMDRKLKRKMCLYGVSVSRLKVTEKEGGRERGSARERIKGKPSNENICMRLLQSTVSSGKCFEWKRLRAVGSKK